MNRARPNLQHVPAAELDAETAQTSGMRRFAAISNSRVGSTQLWMGRTHVRPGEHRATIITARPRPGSTS